MIRNNQNSEALRVLAKYHANGDDNDPLVRLEYNEIIQGLEMEEWNSQTCYSDYLREKNRPRLILLVLIAIGTNWVGNGIIAYYLSPILNTIGIRSTSQQAGLNLGLQVWNCKWNVFFFLLGDETETDCFMPVILSTSAALSVDKVGRDLSG